VIVTGYSDFSPLDISRAAGPADKIFYIAKPFQAEEVMQTATALSHRWEADGEAAAARSRCSRSRSSNSPPMNRVPSIWRITIR
jgi:hypothetical protein